MEVWPVELELEQEKAFSFADGAYVDFWTAKQPLGSDVYKLQDGTELLTVYGGSTPNGIGVGGLEMNEAAQQTIWPTCSNDAIICFSTEVILPLEDQIIQIRNLGAVFDRNTEESIHLWDLFTAPEHESKKQLLAAVPWLTSALRSEMETALKAEYIILYPDHLKITFPQGSLQNQELDYSMGIEYQDLTGVLCDWAVPK